MGYQGRGMARECGPSCDETVKVGSLALGRGGFPLSSACIINTCDFLSTNKFVKRNVM